MSERIQEADEYLIGAGMITTKRPVGVGNNDWNGYSDENRYKTFIRTKMLSVWENLFSSITILVPITKNMESNNKNNNLNKQKPI